MKPQMYDELVSALRNNADHYGFVGNNGLVHLLTNAADAIEELQKGSRENDWWAKAKVLTDLVMAPLKWIPVTERLPESGERVLACCRVKWVGGGGRAYVCVAFHSDPKKETCCYSDGIDMEYDEETDEYYLPEGWWEAINNWDDYSFVAIGDFVTHWMPLPSTEGLNET